MNEQGQPTEEDMEKAARRSIAFTILPAVIRELVGDKSAQELVEETYRIADEMIKQGE